MSNYQTQNSDINFLMNEPATQNLEFQNKPRGVSQGMPLGPIGDSPNHSLPNHANLTKGQKYR